MRRTLGTALAVALACGVATAQTHRYDLLIRNARVVDGTGNPYFRGDIGIVGDTIVAVGRLDGAEADRIVDASGLYAAPGFIDMHSHADRALVSPSVDARSAPNLVTQGITTVVVAPDGRNALWPLEEEIAAYGDPGTALNVVPMVGHGTVRRAVLGPDADRPATEAEILAMARLVRQGMELGAWGLGAGPEYRPGRFATTEELVALARVVAEYDGFYYAHQRSQSRLPKWQLPSLVRGPVVDGVEAMKETIRIAAEAGVRAVGSHIKAKGRSSWGRARMDTMAVRLARAEGHEVYLDHYPYETYGGGPAALVPRWALVGPEVETDGSMDDPVFRREGVFRDRAAHLERVLADPASRRRFEMDTAFLLDLNGGADRIVIVDHPDAALRGRTLADVARERGTTPLDVLVDFVRHGDPRVPDGALLRPLAMHDDDNDEYIRQDFTATSSDAGVVGVAGFERGPASHPRYYGAFVRKIARYVKDKKVVSLPFAVRSMTGLGAQIVGLSDRGLLREGYKADVVLFDLERLRDRATVLEPQRPSEGIESVFVNGVAVLDGGRPTGALPGRVLLKRQESGEGRPSP